MVLEGFWFKGKGNITTQRSIFTFFNIHLYMIWQLVDNKKRATDVGLIAFRMLTCVCVLCGLCVVNQGHRYWVGDITCSLLSQVYV